MTDEPRPVDWILALDSPAATLALVGGKGANLAKLVQAGFPVPDGFLLTTQAYWAFLQANDLTDWVLTTVAAAQANDPAGLERISAQIRARFAERSLPTPLAAALRSAYLELGSPPVAVRSSATAEDLPDMSFAGQQDTYLNITNEDELLQAVIRCWSSLWTARAIGYRQRNGIPQAEVALAVVVQEMVPSEASGVLFTLNPLTGNRQEIVIDATLGLGEALVSGLVEPDHYVVRAADGMVVSKTLGAKALAIHSQQGGGTVTVNQTAATQQALPDATIKELAFLGHRVMTLYGSPQDIEWGWAGGKLYLLQARPITSLFPIPAGAASVPLDLFVSVGAIQGVLDPITPLGRDAIAGLAAGAGQLFGLDVTLETQPAIWTAGERLWARVTPLLRNHVGQVVLRKALSVIEPGGGQALDEIIQEPAFAQLGWPQPTTLAALGRLLLPILSKALLALLRPEQSRSKMQATIEAWLQALETQVATTVTLHERLALFERTLYRCLTLVLPNVAPRMGAGLLMMNRVLSIAADAWGEHGQQLGRSLEVTRGLPNNVTTEMDLALWSTAQTIRQDPAGLTDFLNSEPATLATHYLAGKLPGSAQVAVGAFLQRYGMRGLAEIDLGRPRWRDDPTPVMQTLQSYLRMDDSSQAPDALFRRGAARAEQAIADLAATVRTQPRGEFKAWLVCWMAQRMRALAGLRESPKFFLIRTFGILRQMMVQIGAELVQAGKLSRADDVFFLRLAELRALDAGYLIDWPALVAERRALHEREQRRRQIPRLILSDGRTFYEGIKQPAELREGVLIGSPVSPGLVEGTVHVVFDPHQAQLAPGEILVCPGTDPSWTPLFLAAGGLVMEVGGLMTHGSVVAREYGIPAVVGVHEVTNRLHSGQRVRVDGSRGEVTILDGVEPVE